MGLALLAMAWNGQPGAHTTGGQKTTPDPALGGVAKDQVPKGMTGSKIIGFDTWLTISDQFSYTKTSTQTKTKGKSEMQAGEYDIIMVTAKKEGVRDLLLEVHKMKNSMDASSSSMADSVRPQGGADNTKKGIPEA